MTPVAACTISSNNYLALTRVFAESYREHHPGAPVYVCIVDRPDSSLDYARMPFTPIFAEELGIPSFPHFAFRYDILELNTAVKPYVLTYLRDRYKLDRIFYFDPDIMVHDRLTRLEEALDSHLAVLTPHITEPLDNVRRPPERFIRACGVYNLGFLGIRFNEQTSSFLDWWTDRLNRYCFSDLPNGIFVDQSWMAFAPAYLDSVAVVRDPIFNIAYWNLPHRRPVSDRGYWQIDGDRVGFFHFSGLDLAHLEQISKHQDRVDLGSRPELRPLFEEYRDRIIDAGHHTLRKLPYYYGRFSDNGVPIPRSARLALRTIDPEARRWHNPFIANSKDSFFTWLCEPIELDLGFLTRAALFLWEERSDLIAYLPDVLGKDLPRYIDWLRDGGAEQAKLHPAFLANIKTKPGVGRVRRDEWRIPQHSTLSFDQQVTALAAIDLGNPGTMTTWLNQPLTSSHPTLTRLAMLLYQTNPHLHEAYPDPLGKDRRRLGYWITLIGAREHKLHPDLVKPIRSTLPLRSRLGIRLRELRRGLRPGPSSALPQEASAKASAPSTGDELRHSPILDEGHAALGHSGAPAPEQGTPAAQEPGELGTASAVTEESKPRLGINLVRIAANPGNDSGLVAATMAALEGSELDCVEVAVSLDLPKQMARDLLRDQAGTPHAITLLHGNPHQTTHLLQVLPAAVRSGSYRIAYWSWDLSHVPLSLNPHYDQVDEIWVPSRFCLHAVASTARVPVRWVPPAVAGPLSTASDRRSLGLDPDRFYFCTRVDIADHPEKANPDASLACLGRVLRSTKQPVGLLLLALHSEVDPAWIDRLTQLAGSLPVVIDRNADTRQQALERLAACDAYLSLHRCGGFDQLAIDSMLLGKPVLATGYGGITDVLDTTTGYPIPYKLSRLGNDYGFYPAGAVWAEIDAAEAAAAMLHVLEHRDEAAQLAAKGRERVLEIYAAEGTCQRITEEVSRIRTVLDV